MKDTGNKARDQHSGRNIPVRVPGEYFPSPVRDGSRWALGLPLCPATVGDSPSVPLHWVRGDTWAPDKALRMHRVSSAWPCFPPTHLDPLQTPAQRAALPSQPSRSLAILGPSWEYPCLCQPRGLSGDPGWSPGREGQAGAWLAPGHLGLCRSDTARSPLSVSQQTGHPEGSQGSRGKVT